jgi:hypothetical protein
MRKAIGKIDREPGTLAPPLLDPGEYPRRTNLVARRVNGIE